MPNTLKINSILYVEDEKNIQEELSKFLKMFCNNLYLADDGVQGLSLYKKYNPDLIISDIKMPFMNGIDMAYKIREINEAASIIFTTAFSDSDFFQKAIELQVDGYIIKPIDLGLLENKILNIIKNNQIKIDLEKKEQMLIQQSKLASMGEMIGNISHQWKQPLSVISTHASNIKFDHELEQLDKDNLMNPINDILNQVQYLSKTIDNFRVFFKPYNTTSTFNIKKFLDKCIDLVKSSFDENTIEAIQDIDYKIDSLGDPNQLTQALINILNNAKDALKNAENIHKKLVFIISVKENDKKQVVISIKDNAGGIPENIIKKVFEPYFTTKGETGTGLGLYISHTIITKNLKGTIEVINEEFEYENHLYKGANFIIKIPLSEE